MRRVLGYCKEVPLAGILFTGTDAVAAKGSELCRDATDAEAVSRFDLPSCTAARSVCGEVLAVRQACPHTCGECDRDGLQHRRRAQSETPHEPSRPEPSGRHSSVYRLGRNVGRPLQLSWSFGNRPPYYKWSLQKQEWEGFIPDLLWSVCEELGMDMVFESPVEYGKEIAGFMEGRFQVLLGNTEDFKWYGRNSSLEDAYGIPAARSYFQTMPQLPSVDLYTSPYTVLLRKEQKDAGLWRLFEPFTGALWAAIVATMTAVGLGMSCLSVIQVKLANVPPDERISLIGQGVLKAQYHAWAALFGGEDFECVLECRFSSHVRPCEWSAS